MAFPRIQMGSKLHLLGQILIASAMCLGIGIWIQHQYTVYAIGRAVLDRVWSDLEFDAGVIRARLANSLSDPTDGDGRVEARIAREAASLLGPGQILLIVPGGWGDAKVVHAGDTVWAPVARNGYRWSVAAGEADGREGAPARGDLRLGDEPHVGVIFPLSDGSSRAVLSVTRVSVDRQIAAVAAELGPIAALTFFWILTVTAPAAYMLVAGIDDRVQRQRQEATAAKMQKVQ